MESELKPYTFKELADAVEDRISAVGRADVDDDDLIKEVIEELVTERKQDIELIRKHNARRVQIEHLIDQMGPELTRKGNLNA